MALTKVIGSGVGELTNKVGLGLSSPAAALHVQTSTDGTGLSGDDIYVARFHNQEATSDRSFGVDIQAGSSTTDQALRIKDHDGTNTLMIVDGLGHVTKPLQPAFYAVVNSSQDNIATGQWHVIIFGLERFDSNADFNNSNGTFTAPVTGKYQLNTSIRLTAADTAANAYLFRLNGSNRAPIANYDGNQYATDTEITVQLSALLDMDANDTVTVEVYQDGGTAQTDIQNGEYSFFNGILVGQE